MRNEATIEGDSMLTGHVTGYSRKELLDKATQQATSYYAPDESQTIDITLHNEQACQDEGYADGGLLVPPSVVFEAVYIAQLSPQSAQSADHSALDKVRSLHRQIERMWMLGTPEYVCEACEVTYPCPTMVAIEQDFEVTPSA